MDPTELALVRQAIASPLSNCCDRQNDRVVARVRREASLRGLTPEYIKQRLRDDVRLGGGVDQRLEDREGWKDQQRFWYRVVFPEHGFPRGVFVEVIMV